MMDSQINLEHCQRVYAEVDLRAIRNNMRNMKRNIAEHTKMIAVIKTDGYGHGAVPIAKCLEPEDYMYGYAVATAEEAEGLREAGLRKPILVLGYTFPYSYEMFAREEIRPAVFRKDCASQLGEAALKAGKPIKVHIKVDTGMGRIGIAPDEEGIAFIKTLMNTPGIEIEGIFTHFAKADYADKGDALEQLSVFVAFVERVEKELSLPIPLKHCANSAAILELPDSHMDVVRAGISLYGLMPSDEVGTGNVVLEPAMSLYSHIVYVKTMHAGESISYGRTYRVSGEMRVATIPIGYGDGYPRSLSDKGYVLIAGKKAPILGRVCMDQFMVDVTDIPEAVEGERVVLIGKSGEEQITAELLGDLSGRFNYELVCDLNKRVPRVYVE